MNDVGGVHILLLWTRGNSHLSEIILEIVIRPFTLISVITFNVRTTVIWGVMVTKSVKITTRKFHFFSRLFLIRREEFEIWKRGLPIPMVAVIKTEVVTSRSMRRQWRVTA